MADEQTNTTSSPSPNHDPSTMLSGILSDPAMLTRLGAIIGSLQNQSIPQTNTPPQNQAIPSASESTASSQPIDGLTKVLSDPALMEKLPQIMTIMKPLLTAETAAKPPESAAAVPASAVTHSHTTDRDNLLMAIKPFLSSGRRDAVDTILRVAKLGEFLKQMK